jgi:hypothetical protein
MSLYPRLIALHDIADVEGLCTRAARVWARNLGRGLSSQDMESLISFLVWSGYRMADRYDRERSSSFEAVVRGRLANRCVDWIRENDGRTRWQFRGHTYERHVPFQVSLDAAGDDGGTLADSVGVVDRDFEADSVAAVCGGLLEDRDSEEDWDLALVRAIARGAVQKRGQRDLAA